MIQSLTPLMKTQCKKTIYKLTYNGCGRRIRTIKDIYTKTILSDLIGIKDLKQIDIMLTATNECAYKRRYFSYLLSLDVQSVP